MVRRIFAVFVSCLIVLGGLNLNSFFVKADNLNWSDEGIRAESYENKDEGAKTIEISSAEELGLLSYEVDNGNKYEGWTITLKNDIDLSGHNWEPIGKNDQSDILDETCIFKGTFDGDNHTISNMNINVANVDDNNESFGFFALVYTGCVKNLNFENCNVEIGNSDSSINAGIVSGAFSGSEVSNITVDNSVINVNGSLHVFAGGLCGSLYDSRLLAYNSNIKNIIVSDVTISSITDKWWNYRGGIIGFINEFKMNLSNCYANNITFVQDSMQTENDFAGDLGGYGNGGKIQYCYHEGENAIGDKGPSPSVIENSSKVVDGKLETPVTIDGKTYDSLVGAMNAWVEQNGGDVARWDCDSLGVSHDLKSEYADSTYHKLSCKNCSYSTNEVHKLTLENKKDATCTSEGYTGDEVCSVCKEVIKKGSVIEKTAHNYVDGKCSVCGAVDPNYNPNPGEGTLDDSSQNASPGTGDSSNMTMWIAILVVCVVVIGGSIVYMKKKK